MELYRSGYISPPMKDQVVLSDATTSPSIDPNCNSDCRDLRIQNSHSEKLLPVVQVENQVSLDGHPEIHADDGSNVVDSNRVLNSNVIENGHENASVNMGSQNVYDFDPRDECNMAIHSNRSTNMNVGESRLKTCYKPNLSERVDNSANSQGICQRGGSEGIDYDQEIDSEAGEADSYNESYDDSVSEFSNSAQESYDPTILQRRGRGRPRGSKNGSGMGRGKCKSIKFQKLSDDRSCTSYDLRNIPDPFSGQRRGRPRSRFIVDLGEHNHEAWAKAKDELNISDAELTTLLLSLHESRRESPDNVDKETMLGLVAAEYSKWKEKFTSQVSLLSHYSSIHNTNCCTCLGIKKKKYVPAGTGQRGRPRKYPPPVGCEYKMPLQNYGPGMQRPENVAEDGSLFEPQVILKDGAVKNEPPDESTKMNHENGPHPMSSPNGVPTHFTQLANRQNLSHEEVEKRKEYYNNHKNKVKYVCHYCQVHFYHKPNFDYHINKLDIHGKCKIFEKVNNLYLCETCGEGFSWREKLEKHLRLSEQHGTHNQKELLMYGDFQCNMCGKTFNKRNTYLQHIKWHEEREDIPCVICGTTFRQAELRRHLMEVHSNDSLPCCYCGKLFTSRKYLEKHEMVHQGGNFPCPECGKVFSQKDQLQLHLKGHAADREYSCDQCGQMFNQRMGLCPHLRKHFSPSEFNWECNVCGQFFANEFNMKIHQRKTHNLHLEHQPESMSDPSEHQEYMSPMSSHMTAEEEQEKAYDVSSSVVKNMMEASLSGSINLTMKQEGDAESMDDGQGHLRDTPMHLDHMRHLAERRERPPDPDEQIRMSEHQMAVNDDHLHMPQDLTRMAASHMSNSSGRISAAPQSHMADMRVPPSESPVRMTDTPGHMEDLSRAAVENFGRMAGGGGYLAEHLRRMAENQSREPISHYDDRDYTRLGDIRSMSRGSAGDPMGRLGDNLSHMGVIRPTQAPSSTPQWPPHMQNHAAALDNMNQSPQTSQHLYSLPFWPPYDPSLRQYHH